MSQVQPLLFVSELAKGVVVIQVVGLTMISTKAWRNDQIKRM